MGLLCWICNESPLGSFLISSRLNSKLCLIQTLRTSFLLDVPGTRLQIHTMHTGSYEEQLYGKQELVQADKNKKRGQNEKHDTNEAAAKAVCQPLTQCFSVLVFGSQGLKSHLCLLIFYLRLLVTSCRCKQVVIDSAKM